MESTKPGIRGLGVPRPRSGLLQPGKSDPVPWRVKDPQRIATSWLVRSHFRLKCLK